MASYLRPETSSDLSKKESKKKVVPVYIMKAYRGSKGIAPLLILSAEWRWEVSIMPWTSPNLHTPPPHISA